jgi:hypothetical protein
VDRAPPLVLGHLGERDPHQPPQLPLAHAGELRQGPIQVDGGPGPQPTSQGVPQHLGAGLVAAPAQRLTEPRVVGVVALPAADPATMRAALALPVGMARVDQQPVRPAGVDPAEGRGGEAGLLP